MSCPRCSSTDLWDDNLWWGCNACGYSGSPDGGSMIFAKDIPELPRTVKEVNENAGWTWVNYQVQEVKAPVKPADEDE